MHMCGDKIVRVRESFMNNRGFFKYVCLDFTLYCMVFHWIFLIRAVVVIFFRKHFCLQIFMAQSSTKKICKEIKVFKNLLKNYNATICDIIMQAFSDCLQNKLFKV